MFHDDMKKEGKRSLPIAIFFFIMTVVWPLSAKCGFGKEDFSDSDLIKAGTLLFLSSCALLYVYLYLIKYEINVFEGKLKLNTLFAKKEIMLAEVVKYEEKRFRSSFYQFIISTKNEKIVIRTRYREEFKGLLESYIVKGKN